MCSFNERTVHVKGPVMSLIHHSFFSFFCSLVYQRDLSPGALSISGYSVYAQYVSVEYFNPDFNDLK